MAIKRIGLSWIGVKDINKSKDFFINTLGLKVLKNSQNSDGSNYRELKMDLF